MTIDDIHKCQVMKRAIIKIGWDLFKSMFATDNIVNVLVQQGLPKDAKILNIRNNNWQYGQDTIEIVIESEELDEVTVGELLPEHRLIFQSRKN